MHRYFPQGVFRWSLRKLTWAVGRPTLGGLSDQIGRRKPLYLTGTIIASAGWLLLLYIPSLPIWAFIALIIIVGYSSGAMIIGFAFAKESVPPPLAGTVSGVCNMGVMLRPMILQPLMGWMLDRNWNGALENGVRIYTLDAYQAAFVFMIGWSILAVVVMFCATESNCRQMVGDSS